MTTQSWSGVLDNSNDAGFRAWGSDYSAHLALIGLVQTTDTGQINWATVTKPTVVNAMAGYEIWRFNDSLQATAPIFLKIEYGQGNISSALPGMFVTVGTGTNGAGTLTGLVTTRTSIYGFSGGSGGSATTAYPSYFCHTTGFLGSAFRVGYRPLSPGCMAVCRYSDDDGTPNGNGFTLHALGTNLNSDVVGQRYVQSVRTQAPSSVFAGTQGGTFASWPHAVSGSSATEAGDLQVVPTWTITKQFQQEFGLCCYLSSEIATGSTFVAAVKGAARTFIALGNGLGLGGLGPNDGRGAFIWE